MAFSIVVLFIAVTIADPDADAKNPRQTHRYAGDMERATGFARVGDAQVAYQVTGTGPIDLIITPGSFVSFDVASDDPMIELFFSRLASFTRLIRFDRSGIGASDPVPLDALPSVESYIEETLAVMDAVGSERAAIMASYDAGPMAMQLAATRSERVSALVLSNTSARARVAEDYPIGLDPKATEQLIAMIAEAWGSESQVAMIVPSRADDPRFVSWFAKLERMTISPAQASAYLRAMIDLDDELAGRSAQMLLQIHDELVIELPEDEVAEVTALTRTTMEGIVDLDVPLKVEVASGRTLADAKQ